MGKGNQLLSFSFSLVPQCHRQDKIRQKIRGNYYDTLLLLAHPGKSAPPSPLGAAHNPWPHGTRESFGKSFSNAQSILNVHRPHPLSNHASCRTCRGPDPTLKPSPTPLSHFLGTALKKYTGAGTASQHYHTRLLTAISIKSMKK